LIATPQNPYDENEDMIDQSNDPNADGSQDQVDQRVGETTQGDNTHNTNNQRYNRYKRRKRAPGNKQKGQVAGLPRQANLNRGGAMGIGRSNAGTDRSGG
jgi:hypothetical protein